MTSIFYKHRFATFILLAIMVDYIPLIKWPFLWCETFFHEISHGFAALLTGGSILSIQLDYSGSGVCMSSGGIRFIVALSGYFGSALWGMLIFLLADSLKPNKASILAITFLVILLVTSVFWAKGFSTFIIIGIMFCVFACFFKFGSSILLKSILQFTGIYIVLDAIRSPLALIDGQSIGDGATLSSITFIPEIIWVGLWFTAGIICLFLMFKASSRTTTVYSPSN